ncbi:hypothetical protein TS65_22845 [Aneurinibacillus migulanus]|uniref:Uncharacterized protein n=1 Tax=Aneurinibacillus migulanus TaxID=47500 RepID=A0A0D1V0Q9_ANEMI|nr:hypothetical protein TS65_22845 [Aneurinibacillus migulanus]KON95208.1 hypothetical protein AF333_06685 [Aneurinibacillus migulanus]
MGYSLILQEVERLYKERHYEYGNIISLQHVSEKLKMKCGMSDKGIREFWEQLFKDSDMKYKYTFVTLPKWSGNHTYFQICNQPFSHFIIQFE